MRQPQSALTKMWSPDFFVRIFLFEFFRALFYSFSEVFSLSFFLGVGLWSGSGHGSDNALVGSGWALAK